MGVLQIPTSVAGTVNVFPTFKYFVTTDNLATITTPGYLNPANTDSAQPMLKTDIASVLYNYNEQSKSGTYGLFTVLISTTGVITLSLIITDKPIAWIPIFTFSNPGDLSVIYSQRFGFFSTFSGLSYCYYFLVFTPTFSTSSGNMLIDGLPNQSFLLAQPNCGSVSNESNIIYPSGATTLDVYIGPTSNSIQIIGNGSGINPTNLTTTNLTSGVQTFLAGYVQYFFL